MANRSIDAALVNLNHNGGSEPSNNSHLLTGQSNSSTYIATTTATVVATTAVVFSKFLSGATSSGTVAHFYNAHTTADVEGGVSSNRLIAAFSTTPGGSYAFDVACSNGLVVIPTGVNTPSLTIVYRT